MGEQKRRKELQDTPPEPRDISRTLWVVAVMAFWISVGITVVVTLFTGKLDLILVSISLGMMILGIWLKARYQLEQRKKRKLESNDSSPS